MTYISAQPGTNLNLFQRFSKKLNGELEYPWFIAEGAVGSEQLERIVLVLDDSKVFKEINYLQHDKRISTESKVFYGPAANASEATLLSKKFMDR